MDNEEFELLIQKATIGCCTKEELLDAKERLESAVEDKNAECADYEQAMQIISLEGKDSNDPEEVKRALESYGVTAITWDEIKELQEQRNKLAYFLTNITAALDEFKNFNKYTCFNNIRALLKVNPDVKIGMIEKEAGVRLGYMSRLEKPDNSSEPTLEFVATAAKMLGVSIDFLISVNFDEVTPTEKYVLEFIKKIADDSKCEKLYWNRESNQRLNSYTDIYSNYGPDPHPLQSPADETMDCDGNYRAACFYSRFYPENKVQVTGNVYLSRLEDAESDIYILPCAINLDSNCEDGQECYEIYIIAPDKSVVPLCNTIMACDLIKAAVKDLYMQIEVLSSHVNIDKKARSIIDAYLNKDKKVLSKIFKAPEPSSDDYMPDIDLPFN